LPTGWVTPNSGNSRTVFILLVSLILAGMIALSIVGSICWRKRRKKQADKDLERKGGKFRGPKDHGIDAHDRIKSRLWAKASARWKDNVRHSARRRRNARLTSASMSQLNDSSLYLSRSSLPAHTPPPLTPSRSTTPAPASVFDHRLSNDDDDNADSSASRNAAAANDHEPPAVDALLTSPPAYHGSTANPSSTLEIPNACPPKGSDEPPDATISSFPYGHLSSSNNEGPRYTPPLHVAHVATDDKAVLQNMVVMGSEPPVDDDSSGGSHNIVVSAPVLYEDDEQSTPDDAETLPTDGATSSIFPAPPEPQPSSKGKMAAFELYHYDDLDVEPPPGPSAPPFEASDCSEPSAPLPTDIMTPIPDEHEVGVVNNASSSEDVVGGIDLQAGSSSHTAFQNRGRTTGGRSQSELLPQYQP
jgi:hypothetical protein